MTGLVCLLVLADLLNDFSALASLNPDDVLAKGWGNNHHGMTREYGAFAIIQLVGMSLFSSGPLLYFLDPYTLRFANAGSPRKQTKSEMMASTRQRREEGGEEGRGRRVGVKEKERYQKV